MSKQNGLVKKIAKLGVILMIGVSMSADAGLFGFGGISWKEEVLLHDGSKIIVKRSISYGGRHEIGQPGAIKEQEITFVVPNTNKTLTFKSEYSEDIGSLNFNLLALHILNGTPYVVASPNLCLSFNKWGRPNPPYVLFKHDGKTWQRITLNDFPVEFKNTNVAIYLGGQNVDEMVSLGLVSAEKIKELNGELRQPEYHTILREPVKREGPEGCSEMIYGGKESGWHGTGLFGKTYEACMQYCQRERISAQYCPCGILFKGKK